MPGRTAFEVEPFRREGTRGPVLKEIAKGSGDGRRARSATVAAVVVLLVVAYSLMGLVGGLFRP